MLVTADNGTSMDTLV